MGPSCTPRLGTGARRVGPAGGGPSAPSLSRRAGRPGPAPRRGRRSRARPARAPGARSTSGSARSNPWSAVSRKLTSSVTPRPVQVVQERRQPRVGVTQRVAGDVRAGPAGVVAGVGDDVGPPGQGRAPSPGPATAAASAAARRRRPACTRRSTRPPGGPGCAGGPRRRVRQQVVEAGGARAALAGADQAHGGVVGAPVDRLVDAGGPRGRALRHRVVDHLEHRAHRGPQPLGAAVPGRGVVGHDPLAGGPVVEDVAEHPVPPGPEPGEDRGVVGQGDAGELGDRAAAQGQARGRSAGARRAAPRPRPGAAGPRSGRRPRGCRPPARRAVTVLLQQVRRERGTVQRGTVRVAQPRLGHAGQRREGGADVDEPGVGVDESAPRDPRPR